jgi:uncharacterized protein YcaQ
VAQEPIPLERARRIALGAQGFATERPTGRIDRRHLRKVMSTLGLIQLDSVPVIARTQYIVPFSRLGPHEPDLLDKIAYRDDHWIEDWTHQASLVPVTTEPNLRWMKQRVLETKLSKGWSKFVKNKEKYIKSVYDQVLASNGLLASELEDPRPNTGEWWNSRSEGANALSWLFRIGEVGIRREGNFTKRFHVTEDIVPAEILNQPDPPVEDAQRDLVAQSAVALGIGTIGDITDYFQIPMREVTERVQELVEEGVLVERSVEGWAKPAYLPSDVSVPRSIKANTLLSPFDPVVWTRPRASRLFDFEYRIEIYVPKPQRKYGYYVLPWLLGDRLVGRFDLKTDRAASVLRVLGAYVDDGENPAELSDRAAKALSDLAQHVGADDVVVQDAGVFGPQLARDLASRP